MRPAKVYGPWVNSGATEYAWLRKLPDELAEFASALSRGLPVSDDAFPKGVVFELSREHGPVLGDVIPSDFPIHVVSERLRDLLKQSGGRFEFHPVRIRNRAGKLERNPYYVANLLDVVDCMDRAKSDFDVDPDDPTLARSVRRLQLDVDRIPDHVKIFRLASEPHLYMGRGDLAQEIYWNQKCYGKLFKRLDLYGEELRPLDVLTGDKPDEAERQAIVKRAKQSIEEFREDAQGRIEAMGKAHGPLVPPLEPLVAFILGEADSMPHPRVDEVYYFENLVDILAPFSEWSFLDRRILKFMAREAWFSRAPSAQEEADGYHVNFFKQIIRPALEKETGDDLFFQVANELAACRLTEETILKSSLRVLGGTILRKNGSPTSFGRWLATQAPRFVEPMVQVPLWAEHRLQLISLLAHHAPEAFARVAPEVLANKREGDGDVHLQPKELAQACAGDPDGMEAILLDRIADANCRLCRGQAGKTLLECYGGKHRGTALAIAEETLKYLSARKNTSANHCFDFRGLLQDDTELYINWVLESFGDDARRPVMEFAQCTKGLAPRVLQRVIHKMVGLFGPKVLGEIAGGSTTMLKEPQAMARGAPPARKGNKKSIRLWEELEELFQGAALDLLRARKETLRGLSLYVSDECRTLRLETPEGVLELDPITGEDYGEDDGGDPPEPNWELSNDYHGIWRDEDLFEDVEEARLAGNLHALMGCPVDEYDVLAVEPDERVEYLSGQGMLTLAQGAFYYRQMLRIEKALRADGRIDGTAGLPVSAAIHDELEDVNSELWEIAAKHAEQPIRVMLEALGVVRPLKKAVLPRQG